MVGIPASDTIELTGKCAREKRIALWRSKRVFFATPQVIQNDLDDPLFPTQAIKLVCIDEAHKAKGKYAFCEVIKKIHAVNTKFRVIALSATPGKTADVIEIINNLLIAKIEVRTENSIDVRQYTFSKDIQIAKVPLGDLSPVRDQFMNIMEPYFRKLLDGKVITGSNISKGYMIVLQKKFQDQSHPQKSEMNKLFSIVISLLYSSDLLERHGLHSFLNSFKDETKANSLKYFVSQDRSLKSFLEELNEKHKDTNPLLLNVNPLPNGEVPSISGKALNYGHPKFAILKEKLLEYFANGGTKTIIFCEFRDTVMLVYRLLLQLRPAVLPKMLIGQGGAVSQKDQLAVMKDFRTNKVNALVTTSVCEEGIDVGEVDLVICFDINSKNATRFVQRIGRTGRKRNGKVIILAAEGKEEELIREVIATKDKMNKSIHSNKEITKNLYKNSPRLVPKDFMPKCVETKFKIPEVEVEVKAKKPLKKGKNAGPITRSAASITSHFKPVKLTAMEEILDNNDLVDDDPEAYMEVPEPVFAVEPKTSFTPVEPTKFSLHKIKQEFRAEIKLILDNGPKNDFLPSFIEMSCERDLKSLDKLVQRSHSPQIDEVSFDSNLQIDDLLQTSMDSDIAVPASPEKLPESQNIFDSQNKPFEVESRYGNQFTVPEQFNTPFISSPFQPVNRILDSTLKSTPMKPTLKKKSPFEDSPLLKAFDRQTNLSTSTPVTSRIAQSIQTPVLMSKPSTSRRKFTKNAEKSALEFFGLASVDDIFEGMDDDDSVRESRREPSEPPPAPKENFAELLDDDNDFLLDIPLEEDVVESSLVLVPSPPKTKKIRRAPKKSDDWEIDLDAVFAPTEDLNVNITNSQRATETSEIEKENSKALETMKENIDAMNCAIVVDPPSPEKSPQRLRPNFAKLINALKSSNFLSPEPTNVQQFKSPITTSKVRKPVTPLVTPKITSFLVPSPSPSTSMHTPIRSRVRKLIKPSRIKDTIQVDSDDELPTTSFALPIRKHISKKRKRNDFVCTQAEVDGDESSDEDVDESLDGFIANETVDLTQDDSVDMQAKYLESLRSPSVRRNDFKILKLPPPPQSISMIFSQVPQEDDEWEMDSFIVDNDEHTLDSQVDDLEIAERILKEKRKQKQRRNNGAKRRKVVKRVDSSDEDEELKRMREEVNSAPV